MDSTWQKVWASLFGLEAFLVICGNAMAIRVFLKKKFRICKSSYLLVNLTIADVFVGISTLFTLLEVVYSSKGLLVGCKSPNYVQINKLSRRFSTFTLVASLNSLALLAFERALAILIPLRFRCVKAAHYIYLISVSWLLSMVILLKNIWECSTEFSETKEYLGWFVIAIIATSIATIVLSYSVILIKVKYRPPIQVNSTMVKNIKLTKTLMLTTLCALVTWMPRVSIPFLKIQSVTISLNTNLTLLMLVNINSFVNLLVYALRMPAFRKEMMNMIMFVFVHKNRINTELTGVCLNDVKLKELHIPKNGITVSKLSVISREQTISIHSA